MNSMITCYAMFLIEKVGINFQNFANIECILIKLGLFCLENN